MYHMYCNYVYLHNYKDRRVIDMCKIFMLLFETKLVYFDTLEVDYPAH